MSGRYDIIVSATALAAAVRLARQEDVAEFVVRTWGASTLRDLGERAARILEEAIELGQAEGMTRDRAHALVDHVFDKPAGKPFQEAGGISITLLAYCAACGFSADNVELVELERILALPKDHFVRRQQAKADAGVAMAPETA